MTATRRPRRPPRTAPALLALVSLLLAACGGTAATPTATRLATAPATTAAPASPAAQPTPIPHTGGPRELILSTTTSTQDSGLLDALVPLFERQTGYTVKTVAVGSGAAIALGQRGEADVVLAHAPEDERRFVASGAGIDRQLVMLYWLRCPSVSIRPC